MINDGSKDGTLSIIKQYAATDSHIKYISFSRNFGKESALYAGFCNADGDYVATMDADMQDPPSLLPKMLQILETGEYDSVATRRSDRNGEPPVRSWFARKFYKLINKISDADIIDGARDFRLMKREMVDTIVSMEESSRFSKGIFGWIGFRTYWMSYENIERVAGETKWDFWKLMKYAIDGIVDFSQVPLKIPTWLGILFSFAGFITLIISIIQNIISGGAFGIFAIIGLIIFVTGLQLLCTGLVGKYVTKSYFETKKRPHYIVSESNINNCKKK